MGTALKCLTVADHSPGYKSCHVRHIRHEWDSSSCNEMAFYEVCADKLSNIVRIMFIIQFWEQSWMGSATSVPQTKHCWDAHKQVDWSENWAHWNSICSSLKLGVTSVNSGICPHSQNLFLSCSWTERYMTLLGAMIVRTLLTLERNYVSRITSHSPGGCIMLKYS